MDKENQLSIKILSVGDSQVGKSCLIKRYCEDRFVSRYITTIGVDYGVKKMTIKGKKVAVKINFFDLSGSNDYELIRNEFYKNSQGVIIVFDLDDKDTFKQIGKWEKDMKKYGVDKNAVITLVGNKSDLKSKQVDLQEVQKYAKSKGWDFVQASANTGENVKDLFEKMFNKIVDNIDAEKSNY